MGRPPLRDVAQLAGVSEPTVSRVLNGKTGVAEETRQRVVNALLSLGFDAIPTPRPDRRNVVGILCGEFLNPVFPTFIHHLSNRLARKGYLSTVAVSDPDLTPEARCVDELVRNQVSGLIFVSGNHAELGSDHRHYHQLAAAGTPMVFVNGTNPGVAAPHVWCDEEAGARKAVSHLVRLGHVKIGAILGPARYVPTERFIRGYRHAMHAHGLDVPDEAIVEAPFTLEGARAAASRMIAAGITGVFAGNDLMALGALSAADASPDPWAFSAIGYDGTDFTGQSNPPLTTLRQPFNEMAELIVDTITTEIETSVTLDDVYVFEPELVVRESTRPAPVTTRS